MKIVLSIQVYTPSNQEGLTFTKSFNSNIIPAIGTKIKDPIFVEDKVITDIVLNYAEDTCFVYLVSKEVPDGRLDGHIQEVAQLHNWIESKSK